MDQIEEIAERLRTQDNRLTEHPLYVVYDNMTIFVVDFDHADRFVWVDDEYREADSETLEDIAQIEGYENEVTIAGTDYRRIGVRDERQFVTACLTMEAAKRFIEDNQHHLCKPFVYAESLSNNPEMIAVRKYLTGLSRRES